MKTIELKVTPIGNSRGIRIPAEVLRRHRIGNSLLLEERSEGLMLYPREPPAEKLSWEETALEMAAADEDWGAWDETVADGLGGVPWIEHGSRGVSESRPPYGAGPRKSAKK